MMAVIVNINECLLNVIAGRNTITAEVFHSNKLPRENH